MNEPTRRSPAILPDEPLGKGFCLLAIPKAIRHIRFRRRAIRWLRLGLGRPGTFLSSYFYFSPRPLPMHDPVPTDEPLDWSYQDWLNRRRVQLAPIRIAQLGRESRRPFRRAPEA